MFRAFAFAALAIAAAAGQASAADWLLAPSTYTHSPETGERVAQYARVPPVYVQTRPDYLKSGYRHNRSSIYSGDGADNQHIVEQWGRPVRPYGEWLHPYRPYSVPYQLWGAPFAGLGLPYQTYPYTPPQQHGRWLNPNAGGAFNGGVATPAAPGPNQPWMNEGDKPPQFQNDWGGASGPT